MEILVENLGKTILENMEKWIGARLFSPDPVRTRPQSVCGTITMRKRCDA
jgi:hypothetical protein